MTANHYLPFDEMISSLRANYEVGSGNEVKEAGSSTSTTAIDTLDAIAKDRKATDPFAIEWEDRKGRWRI